MASKKRCYSCKVSKKLGEFGALRSNPDKHAYACKVCRRELAQKYYKRHRRKLIEGSIAYHKSHPESKKKADKKYYTAHKVEVYKTSKRWANNNRDKMNGYVKDFYRRNPQRRKEQQKRYVENNRDAVNLLCHKRRALKRIGDGICEGEWILLKGLYGNMCLACSKKEPSVKLELDHVIPLSHGGCHVIENAQPLCGQCNKKSLHKLSTIERYPNVITG